MEPVTPMYDMDDMSRPEELIEYQQMNIRLLGQEQADLKRRLLAAERIIDKQAEVICKQNQRISNFEEFANAVKDTRIAELEAELQKANDTIDHLRNWCDADSEQVTGPVTNFHEDWMMP